MRDYNGSTIFVKSQSCIEESIMLKVFDEKNDIINESEEDNEVRMKEILKQIEKFADKIRKYYLITDEQNNIIPFNKYDNTQNKVEKTIFTFVNDR